MIECFNNIWIILICIYLFYLIIKKLYKLIFDNNDNIKNKESDLIPTMLPTITSYYIGII